MLERAEQAWQRQAAREQASLAAGRMTAFRLMLAAVALLGLVLMLYRIVTR